MVSSSTWPADEAWHVFERRNAVVTFRTPSSPCPFYVFIPITNHINIIHIEGTRTGTLSGCPARRWFRREECFRLEITFRTSQGAAVHSFPRCCGPFRGLLVGLGCVAGKGQRRQRSGASQTCDHSHFSNIIGYSCSAPLALSTL